MVYVFAFAAIFTYLVCAGGIPALRHDWVWPAGRVDFVKSFVDATSGWFWGGAGYPRPYPNHYVFLVLDAALLSSIGPFAALVVTVFVIGAIVAYAGDSLASVATADPFVRATAAAFALFNPWIYAELVAGHYVMVLSCAGLALLVKEATAASPRPLQASVFVACLLPQLQFFLLGVPLILYLASRGCMLPFATALIVSGPTWFGIAAEGPYLASIPYTLEWQNVQSVDLKDALTLTGYFPGYLHAISWVAYPTAAIALLAVAGIVRRSLKRRRTLLWGLLVAVFIFAAAGTRSPLAPAVAAIFLGVHASGVFRELYDLLGPVALAYGFFAAVVAGQSRIASMTFAAASIALAAAWIVVPPFGYWVDARAIPHIHADVRAGYRVALLPAFQPLSFYGIGSGADPDASSLFATDANVLNEYFPLYPVSVALARYQRNRDPRPLAALSVRTIIDRPWFRRGAAPPPDPATNRNARLVAARTGATPPAQTLTLQQAIPIFSLADVPAVGSLDRRIGSDGVFFADAAGIAGPGVPPAWKSLPQIRTITAPAMTPDPDRGWTSADLASLRYPQLGEGIGGAATTSEISLNAVTSEWTLVYVDGTLWDGNVPYHARRPAFSWIATAVGAHTFACRGLCAVIATTATKPRWPLEPQTGRTYTGLPYRALTPWLIEVAVPALPAARLVRFNSRYDAQWRAAGIGQLAHLRIDTAVNGWIVPPSRKARTLIVVHGAAALQAALAVLGLLWTIALIGALCASLRTANGPRRVLENLRTFETRKE